MVGLEWIALNFLSQMLLVYIPKPLTNGVPFHPSLLTFFKHFSDSDLILYLATSSPQSPAVKNLSSLISTIIRFIWVMKTQMLFKTVTGIEGKWSCLNWRSSSSCCSQGTWSGSSKSVWSRVCCSEMWKVVKSWKLFTSKFSSPMEWEEFGASGGGSRAWRWGGIKEVKQERRTCDMH